MADKNTTKEARRPRCLVFFCGGGLTTGAIKDEGYEVIGGIDDWDFAELIYKKNFPECKFLKASVRELTPEKICDAFGIKLGEVDAIQISSPCPGVSSMGDGVPLAAINDLTIVATALAFALNPKVVLFEQVKNLTRKDMAVLLGIIMSFVRRAAPNYNLDSMVLNSWLYGDPQLRERFFLMCVRNDIGKPVWPETLQLSKRQYIKNVLPDAVYMVNRNYGKRTYFPDEPAPTVIGGPDFRMYDGEDDVELVPRDYARFMGVPDWFELEGAVTNQNQVLGNGVPWGVTRSLFAVIRDHILGYTLPEAPEPKPPMLFLPPPKESVLKSKTRLGDTKIEWTDKYWNPWVGCTKISAGCKNCYMYRETDRWKQNDPSITRKVGKAKFNFPLSIKSPAKIFTCSWSDFFIEYADEWRQEAWDIIRQTPHHTYQILTKRPERIQECLPDDWGDGYENVWLGVSVENQESIRRVQILSNIPATVRFISAEPLLGPLDLTTPLGGRLMDKIQWVIIGGESGHRTGKYAYRSCDPEWMSQLIKDLQQRSNTRIFVKQAGNYLARELGMKDSHGSDYTEFPDWMKIRDFPDSSIITNKK